jgi:hypothetical protein
MKRKIADSLILASVNLSVIAIVYAFGFVKRTNDVSPLLALLVVPVLFLFTLAYTIRDFIRPGMRIQAILASALSVPTVMFLRSIKL